MEPSFSEFSYGYALTEELVRQYHKFLSAAPSFPSLLEEGKKGGGYDVSFNLQGHFIFLQFKLSHYMKRKTAAEWKHFGSPYYRFWLRPLRLSRQHDLLLQLENKYKFVYYAAPAFYEVDDLNNAFLRHRAISQSIFLRPSRIGKLPDRNRHYIAFSPANQRMYFCSSEPRRIEGGLFGANLVEAIDGEIERIRPTLITNESLDQVEETLTGILRENQLYEREFWADLRERPPLQRVVTLTRTFFDCEMLVRTT